MLKTCDQNKIPFGIISYTYVYNVTTRNDSDQATSVLISVLSKLIPVFVFMIFVVENIRFNNKVF